MIQYLVLMSGSCGNSYAFYDGRDTVLVDIGLTYTALKKRLDLHDIPLESVKGCVLTHLHPDHSKGVSMLQKRGLCPVYISKDSLEANRSILLDQKIRPEELVDFSFDMSFMIGDFLITAFRTSHDSHGSAGYLIEHGKDAFFVMTDTGRVPERAYELAPVARVKFIEANYDEAMLEQGPYSARLKARVRGPYGHLSNREAMEFARKVSRRGDSLFFIHVSDNNNTPEKVETLMKENIGSGIFIKALERGVSYQGVIDD